MSWQIARNISEAREQHNLGFGYDSKSEVMVALKDPRIDPYYQSQLGVFEVVSIHPTEKPRKATIPTEFTNRSVL